MNLPMLGCNDATEVLHETDECRKASPQCYIRLTAFHSVHLMHVTFVAVQHRSSDCRLLSRLLGSNGCHLW